MLRVCDAGQLVDDKVYGQCGPDADGNTHQQVGIDERDLADGVAARPGGGHPAHAHGRPCPGVPQAGCDQGLDAARGRAGFAHDLSLVTTDFDDVHVQTVTERAGRNLGSPLGRSQ